MAYTKHPDRNIRQALILLTDALTDWERSTGRKSVLILREVGGFVYRAVNGKFVVPDCLEDAQLMKLIEGK